MNQVIVNFAENLSQPKGHLQTKKQPESGAKDFGKLMKEQAEEEVSVLALMGNLIPMSTQPLAPEVVKTEPRIKLEETVSFEESVTPLNNEELFLEIKNQPEMLPQPARKEAIKQEQELLVIPQTQNFKLPENELEKAVQTTSVDEGEIVAAGEMKRKEPTTTMPLGSEVIEPTKMPMADKVETTAPVVKAQTSKSANLTELPEVIVENLEKGVRDFEITLRPAHLGEVTIKATYDAQGSATIAVICKEASALKALMQEAPTLAGMIENRLSVPCEVVTQPAPTDYLDQHHEQEGQTQQEQAKEQQQARAQTESRDDDFLQQLRLGLI